VSVDEGDLACETIGEGTADRAGEAAGVGAAKVVVAKQIASAIAVRTWRYRIFKEGRGKGGRAGARVSLRPRQDIIW
jgi:hypothetical protein